MKTVDILGTGPSMRRYDWNSETTKWGLASVYPQCADKIDLWFAMHQGQTCEGCEPEKIVDLSNFPVMEAAQIGGSLYFANSIAYMIAYAIMKGFEKIRLYGVDLDPFEEWAFERPCVAYWIAVARMKGLVVEDACHLTESVFLYGYDGMKYERMKEKCEDRIAWDNIQLAEAQKELQKPDLKPDEKTLAIVKANVFKTHIDELQNQLRWIRS